MFTGIITDLGRVRRVERRGDSRYTFETAYDADSLSIGASISCNGVCLTVVDFGPGWFAAQASAETLSKTTLGNWQEGTPVNFERALKVGDELGGHIVSGHVDGLARIAGIRPEGDSHRFVFDVPPGLARFIAPKGSVALDGVSLTVNEVENTRFGVNIIAHTLSVTTFGRYGPGEDVNLEVDMLARYVARMLNSHKD